MDIENEKIREAAYWRERYNILNAVNAQLTRQTYDEVERAFELAQRDIQRDIDAWLNRFAANNGVTLVEARKLLNSNELKEFKWDVAEYIKRGRENAINGKWAKELENASARLHISRLEALKIRTQNHLETAFAAENKAVENLVKNVYRSDYYHTCFELQKGFGVGFDIAGIDERKLDAVVKKPWTVDRRTFSDRIWERKDKMVSALHQEMMRNCVYGRSRKEMTAALEQFVRKDIKNAEFCAARVIKTETAFFTSQSQLRALSELDCEMYEVYLPIGAKSCDICREMNGMHFKLSEYAAGSTAPPFHPNCENGSIIPYYENDFYGKGEPLPDGMSFEEWEKKFVKDSGLTSNENSGIMKENLILTREQTINKAKQLASLDDYNSARNFRDIRAITNRKLAYDGLPKVVDEKTFDSLANEKTVFYRGVKRNGDKSASDIIKDFKFGELWTGNSGGAIYGNGVYFTATKNIAKQYYAESGEAIIEMVLDDSAKIADYKTIFDEFLKTGLATNFNKTEDFQFILADIGQYAAVKGYDAIALNGFNNLDYVVLLNRSKAIVRE